MIIGNGLIAKAFEKYSEDEKVIIFSSGVSNSSETDVLEFKREESLLKKYITFDKKLIYFSTVSIVDGSKKTAYISHKENMENIISDCHSNYLIFRLPIVVGHNANKITFFNSLKDRINNGSELKILNVSRYLIDIDDLSKTLPILIDDDDEKNKTINTCFDNFSKVSDIVERMEFYLKRTNNKVYIDCDKNNTVDNDYFNSRFKKFINSDYNESIFKKYLN